MKIDRHPQSAILSQELLSRPPPVIHTPCTLIHLALMPKPNQAELSTDPIQQAIDQLCEQNGLPTSGGERHHQISLGATTIRWEQHTEFSSVVVISEGKDDLSPSSLTWLDDISAQLLTGTRLVVDQSMPKAPLSTLGYVGGSVMDGQAEIATNLTPDEAGLVTYTIANLGLDEARLGRLAQRLYEIETYRMMALLGLPLAKKTGAGLNGLEGRLIDLVRRLGTGEALSKDQGLLEELFALAQDSEQLMADTDYRFSATQAYGQIVEDRLAEIQEVALPTRQRLGEFLERRFEPALRTTEHITRRQASLSARIARTVSLARTRVEVSLQTQHRTQLETMAHRAKLQLRLQRTVEGLSVMAISYYALGILSYFLGGWMPSDHSKWLISLASPVVLLGIWWGLRRWRQTLLSQPDEDH